MLGLVQRSLAQHVADGVTATDTLLAMTIPAIVLAAGGSSRLGRPKQLVEVGGETLLARTMRAAREANAEPVLVVLGAHAERIRAMVSMENVAVVLNPDWRQGIASSIRAALRALAACAPDAAGVAMLTCDQPRLTGTHLRMLFERFDASADMEIVASAYDGVRGIPAVFPRTLFSRLLALKGDKGAKGILADPHQTVTEVPFAGGEIDIDLPGDLNRLA